jgi:ferredoxin/flavodoxin---NADP+ reductase
MYKIVSKKELVPKIKLFEVEAPDIAAKSQAWAIPDSNSWQKGERIPLTICGYDIAKRHSFFCFSRSRQNNQRLGQKRGRRIDNVTGPLGNPSEIKNFGKVLCVGGSVMIAPLLLQAKAMKEAGNHVTTVIGARTEPFIMLEEEAKHYSDKVYLVHRRWLQRLTKV